MSKLAINTGVASAVFFVVTLFLRGDGFGGEAVMAAVFHTLVFAMMYGAIQVGIIMFKGNSE